MQSNHNSMVIDICTQLTNLSMNRMPKMLLQRAKLSLNKSVSEKLMILFCTVHAVNIKSQTVRDYEFITEMDALKCLELPGDKYKTAHSCKHFTQAITD